MKNSRIIEDYKDVMIRMTQYVHPELSSSFLNNALDYSINLRKQDHPVVIKDNYKNIEYHNTIESLTNYIMKKEPICTSWGVLFNKHEAGPNPLTDLMKEFMDLRGIHKKMMFQHPKGTEEFQKYNLLQLLDKLDSNAIYGGLSNSSCLFYNINVAASITAQGRSLISSVIMFFEMFLSNNVRFGSLDEIITFVYNVTGEKKNRKYKDSMILDRNITIEECFEKIIYSCGDFRRGEIKWVPSVNELDIVWTILNRLDQEDLNRLYYKNNLIAFMDNQSMTNALIYILKSLKIPYLDPNEVPDEVSIELETLTDILEEYVFYNYQIIDRIDRNVYMVKNICAISDTDSAIVSLDGWYHYVLDKVKGMKFNITQVSVDEVKYLEGKDCLEETPIELDYDFYNDDIVEVKRKIKLLTVIPQDNLRYSIINIMSHICGVLVNKYMIQYTKNSHSYRGDKNCLIISKNEFLFKRVLLTNAKKNYATIQEIQEGNMIPQTINTALDIKGLPMNKSTLNDRARDELKRILYEDILTKDEIDQLKVIKDLAIFEKQIYNSLASGEKDFYKPASIKSFNSYDDPMRIQGVKASVVWNRVRDDDLEALDLEARNTIGLVKVNIDLNNVESIKYEFPETYEKILSVLKDPDIQRFKAEGDTSDGSITALAIPVNVKTPTWVKNFIDYTSIINDCVCSFPIESIGIDKMNRSSINYTNILSI